MKSIILICTILLTTVSCSKKEDPAKPIDFSAGNFPQKWVLVKMTGNMQGSQTTGQDMEWQETYLLRADGSFTKTRITGSETLEAEGTYEAKNSSGEELLVLTFNEDSAIIGNCTGDNKETLQLTSDATLQSSWFACDGPGLYYEKD